MGLHIDIFKLNYTIKNFNLWTKIYKSTQEISLWYKAHVWVRAIMSKRIEATAFYNKYTVCLPKKP